MGTVALLSLLPLAALLAGDAPRPPAEALAREQYQMVAAPSALPPEVQSALARHLGQDPLRMAAAEEPFALTDVVMDPSLPARHLIAAAVGKKYVVLHHEQGGIALRRFLTVFERTGGTARVVWSASVQRTWDPPAFERAIHDTTLWEKPVTR